MPRFIGADRDERSHGRKQETCAHRSAARPAGTVRDWYLKVPDAHAVFENEMLCFMTFDDEHHRLAIAQLPQSQKGTTS